ncbi:MAG: hypothetical protein Kow0063_39200 [Anaerolineae bacterium]
MNPSEVRALIVEDDDAWQQILSEILADAGLTVDIAENLETALARLRATVFHLAIVDLCLDRNDHRNQDGLRVLAALQRHAPGCTSLLLTGFATAEIAESASKEYGAFACLRKEDFHRTEFRALLNQVSAGWHNTQST